MEAQDFSTEELLKRRPPKDATYSSAGTPRQFVVSGVRVPPVQQGAIEQHQYPPLIVNWHHNGSRTVRGGGEKYIYTNPDGTKVSYRTYWAGAPQVSRTAITKPDGTKTVIHDRGTHGVDERGHGVFTAVTTKPDGSKEKVHQWVSGLSSSDHGVHTSIDPSGKITSRYKVDNIKTVVETKNTHGGWRGRNIYTQTRVNNLPIPPAKTPTAGGRYQVTPARQARTATAQPQSTGGEVGGKEGHAFHGNQFTAHGTDVPVKNPQATKKSLSGADFIIDNLLRG